MSPIPCVESNARGVSAARFPWGRLVLLSSAVAALVVALLFFLAPELPTEIAIASAVAAGLGVTLLATYLVYLRWLADRGLVVAEAAEWNRLEAVFLHSTDHIYFKDDRSRFLRINPAMARWLGLDDAARAVGRTDADFFAPEHARQALEDERALFEGRVDAVRKEEKETWPGGRVTWVSTTKLPLRDPRGRLIGTFGISRDVTDRRLAEEELAAHRGRLEQIVSDRTAELRETNRQLQEEIVQRRHAEDESRIAMATDLSDRMRAEQVLRESEQRYRRLLNSVTDYVYDVTARDGVVVATRHGAGCEAVTGYTSADYDRNPALWLSMVPQEDRSAVIEHARRIVEGRDVTPIEHRIRRKDGAIRWVRNTPVPRRDAQGRIVGYDGLIKDISDRRAAEDQRLQLELHVMESEREAHLEEVERLSVLGVLAAGVAHEVNNPLQGIVAYLGAIRADLPPGSGGLRNLERVESGIAAIAGLVQRMLQLGSARDDDDASTTLTEAYGAVHDLLEPQLGKAGIRLAVNARAAYARIAMPAHELREILLNLLMNARDAMPAGGTITVQCDRRGDDVVISVSDTGAGIAPDVLPRIFLPFFTTKGKKGTGLGLSTTESLIRSRRGDIRVESAPGRGATFTFRVPMQAAETEAAP